MLTKEAVMEIKTLSRRGMSIRCIARELGVVDPARIAWQAGPLACFGSGLIELGGSLVAERIRRITPRAALLSTLAGIALGFISLGFLYRTCAHPVVGLSTLAVILLTYFGRVHFRGGLVAVALGTALSWILGIARVESLLAGQLTALVG